MLLIFLLNSSIVSIKYYVLNSVLICQQTKVDRMQGANPSGLESKIQQLYGSGDADEEEEDGVAGHVCQLLV